MADTNKKIVLLGGGSAVASYAIPSLSSSATVTTMGRNGCDIDWDACDGHISLPEKTSTVIFLAAGFSEQTDADIKNTHAINTAGVLNACISSARSGAEHFIYISSIYTTLPKTHPYYNLYAITKRQGEEIAEYYCKKNGIKLTILRPSSMYDDLGLLRKHNKAPYHFLDIARKNEQIVLFGNRDAKRNYLHISDFVEILNRVVNLQPEGAFSCANPQNTSLHEIVRYAISASNSSSEIKIDKNRPDEPNTIFPYDKSLYDLIGYTPLIDMGQGMSGVAKKYTKENL